MLTFFHFVRLYTVRFDWTVRAVYAIIYLIGGAFALLLTHLFLIDLLAYSLPVLFLAALAMPVLVALAGSLLLVAISLLVNLLPLFFRLFYHVR